MRSNTEPNQCGMSNLSLSSLAQTIIWDATRNRPDSNRTTGFSELDVFVPYYEISVTDTVLTEMGFLRIHHA